MCVPNVQIQPDQSVQCHWDAHDVKAELLALEIRVGALPWESLFLLLSISFGGLMVFGFCLFVLVF